METSRGEDKTATTHLQPLVEDDLLPLQPNVLWPLDESGEVLLEEGVTACGETEEATIGNEGDVIAYHDHQRLFPNVYPKNPSHSPIPKVLDLFSNKGFFSTFFLDPAVSVREEEKKR